MTAAAMTHAPLNRNKIGWTWDNNRAARKARTFKWYISVSYSAKQQHQMIMKCMVLTNQNFNQLVQQTKPDISIPLSLRLIWYLQWLPHFEQRKEMEI